VLDEVGVQIKKERRGFPSVHTTRKGRKKEAIRQHRLRKEKSSFSRKESRQKGEKQKRVNLGGRRIWGSEGSNR